MNIWNWVLDVETQLKAEGHNRLAEIVDELPSAVCDNEHARADALFHEGLPLARTQGNRWLEVFLRHWHLQSMVFHRHNARDSLHEAIELLEFSHRENTRDCPQSVCVVQDIAKCYGVKDGPGYVPERLDVCREIMQRIDTRWQCYLCIGVEILDAHIDAGHVQEALDEIHRMRGALRQTGGQIDGHMVLREARCLLELGKLQEAEDTARAAHDGGSGESFKVAKQQFIALVLLHQQRVEEARDLILPFEQVVDTMSRYEVWTETMRVYARLDSSVNSLQLDRQLATLTTRAQRNDAIRLAFNTCLMRVDLALARKDAFGSARGVAQLNALALDLHRDAGATESIRDADARSLALSDACRQTPNSLTIDSAVNASDPGMLDLFDLERLHAETPEHQELTLTFSAALSHRGYPESADLLRAHLQRHPTATKVLLALGRQLLDNGDTDEFDARIGPVDTGEFSRSDQISLLWLKVRRETHRDRARSLSCVYAILELDPQNAAALRRAAWVERLELGYERSLELYERLLQLEHSNDSDHWDRIVCATCAQQWDIVRTSSEALGMELSSDHGPVVESWEYIRVRLLDDQQNTVSVAAQRTGPVTATVVEIRRIHEQQFYGHDVVFDPQPLNTLDQTNAENRPCDQEGYETYLFDCVHSKPGPEHFLFDVDGVHPGDEWWDALLDALSQKGCVVSRRSGPQYQLEDPESDDPLPGLYFYVAAPVDVSLDQVQALLIERTESLEHPLIWPRLAAELGDEQRLQQQAIIETRYGLE